MSTKEQHICKFWVMKMRTACLSANRPVSAGEVALRVGQSRSTAKKYLEMAVKNGLCQRYIGIHVNKQEMTCYVPNGDW